ncbi:hypothetical protein VTO73DRAFT_590 [Trametes versicolor]
MAYPRPLPRPLASYLRRRPLVDGDVRSLRPPDSSPGIVQTAAQIRAPRPPSRAHAAVCRPATRGPRSVHQAAHALRGAAPSGENAGCGFCADGGRFGGGGHAEPPVPAASSFAPRRALTVCTPQGSRKVFQPCLRP